MQEEVDMRALLLAFAAAASLAAAPALGSNMTVKLNENLIRVGLNFKYGH